MSVPYKFGEVPPVIKGVITVFVFRVLAPWWQSGELDLADSLARHTFAPLIHHPTKHEPKILSHSEVTERKGIKSVFVFLCNAPYRTETSIKSKNRMTYHVPLLDENTIKIW
jgi:hypothetical protein